MKRAVIYYSLSNNTKGAAEWIAKELGIECIGIDLVKPLPEATGKQMLEGGRQATFGVKPEIKGVPENLEDYDEIILGTPIWAGKCASPVNTLLTKYSAADKVTAVFTFSGGGDNDKCIKKLRKLLMNMKTNVALVDGKYKKENDNEEKLKAFVEAIR